MEEKPYGKSAAEECEVLGLDYNVVSALGGTPGEMTLQIFSSEETRTRKEQRENERLDGLKAAAEVYGGDPITADRIVSQHGGKFLPFAPNVATYHPTRKGWYITAAGEVLREEQIKRDGFKIVGTKPAGLDSITPKPKPTEANQSEGGIVQKAAAAVSKRERESAEYREAILALPEARARPRTVEKLLAAYTAHSMPIHMARNFLAGLPIEDTAESQEGPKMTAHAERMILRATDLHIGVLTTKAARGCMKSKADARALRHALKVKEMTPSASIIELLETSGADVNPIRAMLRKASAH